MTLAVSNLTIFFRVLVGLGVSAALGFGALHALYGILGPFGRLYGLRRWVAWRRSRPISDGLDQLSSDIDVIRNVYRAMLEDWRHQKPGRI
jgi:hypothetical protein